MKRQVSSRMFFVWGNDLRSVDKFLLGKLCRGELRRAEQILYRLQLELRLWATFGADEEGCKSLFMSVNPKLDEIKHRLEVLKYYNKKSE